MIIEFKWIIVYCLHVFKKIIKNYVKILLQIILKLIDNILMN